MEIISSATRSSFDFFGVPVDFISTSPALLDGVGLAYADWRRDGREAAARIEIRLDLGDVVGEGEDDIRVDGQRLTLSGASGVGQADAATGAARARVSRRLVDDPAALAAMTDTLLLFLLTRLGRTPLHAAGVMLGGVAVVLAGPSGSGKSTLALAAMARGLSILSDDTLYIQLRPSLRIWGFRRPLHVFPQDAPRFTQGVRLRGGKLKAVVPLTPEAAAGASADRAAVVLLERGERLALARLDAEATVAGLSRLEPGFDLLAAESAAAIRVLAARGGWRLTLSRDPGAAIDFLRERLPLVSEA
jgi:hypothetical protein